MRINQFPACLAAHLRHARGMSRPFALVFAGLMAAFFACFFLWPIWTTVQLAFEGPDHRFSLDYVAEVFLNPLYREGLLNAFAITLATTLGCLLLSPVATASTVPRRTHPRSAASILSRREDRRSGDTP